ncbi:MAG: tricarballylate utilization protein B [Acidobacteria bacterium RIFCSPLOWO2_12_FULL_67_14b]|nr:MAG: tricarballylate utilization protein B [Acidobacteria bacterium RIFCSPLOWO2_12_FULL_67_14b]
MPADELIRHGQHVMTVCNACRYCEQYCPVFPAMEQRLTFATADLTYLANLCHNCGECLYACQYAPPHEFGIDVPRTLAKIRARSYEDYGWPPFLAVAFRRHNLLTGTGLAAGLIALMFAATLVGNGGTLPRPAGDSDFYAVVPHDVMVVLFGGVFLFALTALWIGAVRFWRDLDMEGVATLARDFRALGRALRDALTLRHLHGSGADCTSAEETRTPWRRWFHHCTFYGFLSCFASTSVAAIYHTVFGWQAPYAYTSLPVLLGTAGGAGLLVGLAGLLMERRRRDPALGDPAQDGLDQSFIALLFLAALTGLLLLVLRERAVMSALLIVHLGVVLALFLTLPYGKFVHGIYRTAALVKYARESLRV